MAIDLTGQVAIVPKPPTFVGWGIAAVTHSHVSHVVTNVGGGMVASPEPGGVRIRSVAEFPTAVYSRFPLTGLNAARVADWARAQEGVPYAFADDALIGLERLFDFRFPRWVRRMYEDDGKWQCAQLAMAALLKGGMDPFPADPDRLGDVAPGDFERLFVRNGWCSVADLVASEAKTVASWA